MMRECHSEVWAISEQHIFKREPTSLGENGIDNFITKFCELTLAEWWFLDSGVGELSKETWNKRWFIDKYSSNAALGHCTYSALESTMHLSRHIYEELASDA